ncbi:hypothetical protein BSKO_13975 [Bryopsis sp. KO-2023]|nr:hypothetical protein BSKO_13975 [Bryopsis sp. KO-2023]
MAAVDDPQAYAFTRMEIKSPADRSWVEIDSLRTHVIGFNDKTWLRIGLRHRSTDYDELLNYETILSGAFWSKGRFLTTGVDLTCSSSVLGFAISSHKDVKSAWFMAPKKYSSSRQSMHHHYYHRFLFNVLHSIQNENGIFRLCKPKYDRDWLCEVVWQMEKNQHKDFGSPVNIWLSVNRREVRLPGKEMPLDHPIISKWLHCMAEVMSDEEHMSLLKPHGEEEEEKKAEANVQPPCDGEFTRTNPRRSNRQKAMKKISMKEEDGRNPPPGTSDENEGDVANVRAFHSPQESGSSKDPNTEMLLLLCDAAAEVIENGSKGGARVCDKNGRKGDAKSTKSKKGSTKKHSTSKTTPGKCPRYELQPTPEDVCSRKRKQEASSNFARHKCPNCASMAGPLHPPPEFLGFAGTRVSSRELGPNPDKVIVGPPCQHHGFLRAGFRRPDVFPPPPMMPLPHVAYMSPPPTPLSPPPPGLHRPWPSVHFRPSHQIPVHIAQCTPYNWCLPPSHPGGPIAGVRIRHCQARRTSPRFHRGNELQIVSAQGNGPPGNQDNALDNLTETT